MADSYTWTVTVGSWSDAANWTDITTGNSGITVPGSNDIAAISGPASNGFDIVSGDGTAATLTLNDNVVVTGTIAAPEIIYGVNPDFSNALYVLAGATIAAGWISSAGTAVVNGKGALLTVSNTLAAYVSLTAEAVDGGSLQVADISAYYAFISVDPTATFEIGTAGGAAAGVLTVDAGATLNVGGALISPVADNGVIVANGLTFADAITGTGIVQAVSPNFPSFPAGVGAGMTVSLVGSGGTLTLGSPASFQATITGFVPGDLIALNAPDITSLSYTPTGTNIGTLSLFAGATTLATLSLAGSYDPGSFLLLPDAEYGTNALIAVATNAPTTESAASAGDSYPEFVWRGTNGGAWNTPSLWLEGAVIGTRAPGASDFVSFSGAFGAFQVITGDGNAAGLTLAAGKYPKDGAMVALAGQFNFDNTVVGDQAALDLLPGSTLTAQSVTSTGTIMLSGSTTRLSVANTLAIGTVYKGILQISGGAQVQAGTLVLGSVDYNAYLRVDATSTAEIGTAGNATAGVLTVDAGAIATLQGDAEIDAPVVDNGTIVAIPTIVPANVFADGSQSSNVFSGTVGGSGVLQLNPGGSVLFDNDVSAGVSIALFGSGDTLNVVAAPAIAASITGLMPGDTIQANPEIVAIAVTPGTLVLQNGAGIALQTLDTRGIAAGESFLAIPVPMGWYGEVPNTQIVLANGALMAGDVPRAGPGTATNDSYVWSGDGGAWSDLTNWTDTSTGANPATVAPGSNDSVSIPQSISAPADWQIISGAGNAATLAAAGNVALSGSFTAAVLTSTNSYFLAGDVGAIAVQAGATLALGNAAVTGTLEANGAGAAITVSGGLTLGAADLSWLFATGGADIQTGSLISTSLGYAVTTVVDATSRIEIGVAGGAVAGAVNIDPGDTLSTGRADDIIDGNVVNDGTMMASGGEFYVYGDISGTGTILMNGGTLAVLSPFGSLSSSSTYTGGHIDAGLTLQMTGINAIVTYPGGSFDASISGFAPGDSIAFNTPVTDVTWSQDTGDLTVTDDGATVSTLHLTGNYSAVTFLVNPVNDSVLVACFVAGTHISTRRGEVMVEALRRGDCVPSASGQTRVVVWTGYRRHAPRRTACPNRTQPIRVRANAFGPGKPCNDLRLSPDHAICFGDVLIPVYRLVNGVSVVREDVDTITYWHVELDAHDILLAEGLPCESYLDTGNRRSFTSEPAPRSLHPELAGLRREAMGCLPVALRGPPVRAAQSLLAHRAALARIKR